MAIPFHPVRLEDKPWIDRVIREADSRSADYNFSSIFMWDEKFRQEVALVKGCLAVRLRCGERPFYACPVGNGDWRSAILTLKEDAAALGAPLEVRGITGPYLEELERFFPGEYTLTENRDVHDYLYEAEKLATLAGKKLHAKRNHINRFQERYPDWRFERLTSEALPECAAFNRVWEQQNGTEGPEEYADETRALDRAFAHFDTLGLEGGILRADGVVMGYTIGEKLNSDTYLVHFEKADGGIQGAYTILNREFTRQILELHPEIRYVNREEDMGRENLRKAKQSYYPAFLVEKYSALWR